MRKLEAAYHIKFPRITTGYLGKMTWGRISPTTIKRLADNKRPQRWLSSRQADINGSERLIVTLHINRQPRSQIVSGPYTRNGLYLIHTENPGSVIILQPQNLFRQPPA